MRKKPKAKYSAKRDGGRAVFDIVCDLRKQKNGDKFIRLYDKGDFSEYGSQSEADAALCALIAFRTGADPDAIDEVFRTLLYTEANGKGTITGKTQSMQEFQPVMVYFTGRKWNILIS